MFHLSFSGQFKRDVKTIQKRNFDISLLKSAITELEKNGYLSVSYSPHRLKGNYIGYWEGHIKPDWVIIWKESGDNIYLTRTGTHSDLF
jgi:mRNA interferase YafQ